MQNKESVTIRQEDFKINSTFISDFLVYLLLLLRGNKSNSGISMILILDFYYFLLNFRFIITYLGQLSVGII
jgi:hypothetical protein